MGWLYMSSLGAFDTPKAYLDDQFDYENATLTSTVIASAVVGMRTWYAACRQVDRLTRRTETFAIVCLFRYNQRAVDGMIFGYKDMTEFDGPCEAQCPASILDLLTPIEHEYALAWRARCREHRQKQARPEPKIGDIIVFAEEIRFTDGHVGTRFRFGKRGRQTVFTRTDGSGAYRIRNWNTAAWSVIPAIAVHPIAA